MIEATAVRGGIVEQLGDASYQMVLRIGEIERFEDAHRGIFDLWDGIFRGGVKPNSKEIRDLVALGLVGGGMKDAAADKVVAGLGAAGLLELQQIATGLLGAAFMPDAADEAKKKVTEMSEADTTQDQ